MLVLACVINVMPAHSEGVCASIPTAFLLWYLCFPKASGSKLQARSAEPRPVGAKFKLLQLHVSSKLRAPGAVPDHRLLIAHASGSHSCVLLNGVSDVGAMLQQPLAAPSPSTGDAGAADPADVELPAGAPGDEGIAPAGDNPGEG